MGKKNIPGLGAEHNAAAETSEFRAAVRDVKPLAQAPLAGIAKPRSHARRRRPARSDAENLDELMPLIATPDAAASTPQFAAGGAALSFQRAGLRPQVMRRLRRGLYPAEDELDLHGLNQTAARDSMADFIARSRDSGRRCVRIIHGKGYRSGARGPVLKIAVDLWLRRHMDVMAFTSARAIDGGTGAVYVLLRG
ncbi:MAG TPA: Smr/MutS family protein [Steroidobacteraceae bacterium]|jgi:DNA-nicking Smr family endonuclease|nr:Smr/MutS family protein [Steroidobacteraceae bacterium]